MPAAEERSYVFRNADHWRAGVRRGLQVRDNRLIVPDRMVLRPILGPVSPDGEVLPCFDTRGRLLWVRPGSGALVRWSTSQGLPLGLGTLDGLDGIVPPRRLVAGSTLLWTVTEGGLLRHDAASLQRLTPARAQGGWRISDAAGDRRDGLWITEVNDDGQWRLRHLDCWGRICRDPVMLPGVTAVDLTVAVSSDAARAVVLDPTVATEFQLIELGPGTGQPIALEDVHHRGWTLLAVGPEDRLHLLTVPEDFGRNTRAVVLQTLDPLSGAIEDHQDLEVPHRLGRPTVLVGGGTDLALACSRGLARLVPEPTSQDTRQASFITPALVSTPRPPFGWDRAEIDAVLPGGTTLKARWAATSENWATDQMTRMLSTPAALGTADGPEGALPWTSPGTTFHGEDGPARRSALLLNTLEETTLWLRIDLSIASGSPAPELTSLRIRYPNISYLDHLPAIYREDPHAAEDLRQILAPYESLLDDIDATLDELPDRIRPTTAPEEWTGYLLGWLGFPPLGDLPDHVRRRLLVEAPGLLDARGTMAGLEQLLDAVTEGKATVTDSSDEPAGWFLGVGNPASDGAGPARLGRDTMVLSQLPRTARAGSVVLGQSRLGAVCPDPSAMLAQRARTITITIHDGVDEHALRAVLDRLLDTFVPAHCRVEVQWPGTSPTDDGRLDGNFRLGSNGAPGGPGSTGEAPASSRLDVSSRKRLGTTTRLGRWLLPPGGEVTMLDRGARLDTESRLL